MPRLFLFCLFLLGRIAISQTLYNKAIDIDTTGDFAGGVVVNEDGSFDVLSQSDNYSTYQAIVFQRFTTDGILQFQKEIKEEGVTYGVSYPSSLRRLPDSAYVLYGLKYIDNEDYGYFAKLTAVVDTIFTRIYGDSLGDAPINMCLTIDGGYLLVGSKQYGNSQNYGELHARRIDSSGSVVWDKKFIGGPFSDAATHVVSASDGSFWVSGTKTISQIAENTAAWLLHISYNGFLIWDTMTYTPYIDGGGPILQTKDGNIAWFVHVGECSTSPYFCDRPYLWKLDTSEGLLSSKRLVSDSPGDWDNAFHDMWNAVELEDGSLLIVGSTEPDTATHIDGSAGFLMKLDALGNREWERKYYIDTTLVGNILSDVTPHPDGGFVAVGRTRVSNNLLDDVWILKVDSMGCLVPGCDTLTNIVERGLAADLSVYPNPASEKLFVALALNRSLAHEAMLAVTNLSGQVIYQTRVHEEGQWQINCRHWAAGTYFISITAAGQTITKRILKQ